MSSLSLNEAEAISGPGNDLDDRFSLVTLNYFFSLDELKKRQRLLYRSTTSQSLWNFGHYVRIRAGLHLLGIAGNRRRSSNMSTRLAILSVLLVATSAFAHCQLAWPYPLHSPLNPSTPETIRGKFFAPVLKRC